MRIECFECAEDRTTFPEVLKIEDLRRCETIEASCLERTGSKRKTGCRREACGGGPLEEFVLLFVQLEREEFGVV